MKLDSEIGIGMKVLNNNRKILAFFVPQFIKLPILQLFSKFSAKEGAILTNWGLRAFYIFLAVSI